MSKWNGQMDAPTCQCGATSYYEHLQRVLGGVAPHPHQSVYASTTSAEEA